MASKLLGNSKKGRTFILSAPAGTGKTTLVQMLLKEFPCIVASVSYTTRKPREGEIQGEHYHFVTEEEFEKKIAEGDFLEYVRLYGYYYGTSLKWVEAKQNEGKHVLLVIDTQGALLLKGKLDSIFIFVGPPSLNELRKRLTNRNLDSSEKIEERLAWAKKEIELVKFYDYHVINDDLDVAYQVLKSILIAEEHRVLPA